MINPFTNSQQSEKSDEILISQAIEGDRKSLEELILKHQAWIYNIVLRMVLNPLDAEDITQEVLIKLLTKLSTFKGKSSFRTWAYRIATNHVINMKKSRAEEKFFSFDEYWKGINSAPDADLPDQKSVPVDLKLIVEETKIHCLMALLLCLDREKRLIFILGEMLGLNSTIGSKILEISKDNYRQKLSRARKKVYAFLKDKCGLINKSNPCHCEKKTKALIDSGIIDPNNLQFNKNYSIKGYPLLEKKYYRLHNALDKKCQQVIRELPFQKPPDYVNTVREILQSIEFKNIFDFTGQSNSS